MSRDSASLHIPTPGNFNKEQAYEFTLLALCVWREARGEDPTTILAVAWTIRNRVVKPGKTWWGDDWEEVILKPWQYSSFNGPDKLGHVEANSTKFPLPGDLAWTTCLQAAERVYFGFGVDPSQGATHYFDDSLKDNPPAWATTGQFIVKLGRISFYKAA